MKKKLFAITIIIVICFTFFVGCDIFTTNEKRDYYQVVATVNHEGMTAEVYKGELLTYFSQNGSNYISQYSWTVEKTLDECLKVLSKKELLVLKARKHFSTVNGVDMNADLEKFLRPDEIQYVRKATNKQFRESLDELVKEVVTEREQNKNDKDEEEDEASEELKKDIENARPQKPEKEEDEEFKADESVTTDKIDGKFDADAEKFTDADEVEAWTRLKKSLDKQYKNYDYFYQVNLKQRLINKYKDDINKDLKVTDQEINERYTMIYKQNLSTFIDDASYKSAIDAGVKDTFAFYHKDKGYTAVKSILLKFNEEQEKLLEIIKNEYPSTSTGDKIAYRKARRQLAEGTSWEQGVKVNVSNPHYNKEKACKVKECSASKPVCTPESNAECPNRVFDRKGVDFKKILQEISADIIAEEAKPENDTADKKVKARMAVFEKWIYLVNGDPGMFEDKNYTITPEGKDSEYVDEFTKLGRALAAEPIGSMQVSDLVGINKDGYGDVFFNEGNMTYCINDFGIHIIMTQYINLVGAEGSNTYEKIAEGKGKDGYKLNLNYVYEAATGKTVYDVINDKILEEKKTDYYSRHERDFFKASEEASIKRIKSIYKKLLSDLEKAYKNVK